MNDTMSNDIWESAYRSYVLVKVTDKTQKVDVARDIWALNDTELDTSQHFVTRATVVAGPFDIIVPAYARSLEKLKELEAIVKSRAGVEVETSEVASLDYTLKPREVHHPWPPHAEARGYVPEDEKNPVTPGPTGSNAWG